MNEFEKFVSKFQGEGKLNNDFRIIAKFIDQILDFGVLERYFRPEGNIKDIVVALPTLISRLRLSDRMLILGNGGEKTSNTYQEDDTLSGYVLTLKKLRKFSKPGKRWNCSNYGKRNSN